MSDLAETEVGKLDVALVIQKYIFWLQISINYSIFVEAFEGEEDLGRVEFATVLREPLLPPEMIEQLTTVQEVYDEVEFFACLEGVMKLHNKWIGYFFKNLPLGLRVLFLLVS